MSSQSFGLVGPAYVGRSPNIAGELLLNLFAELQEAGNSASKGSKYNLYGTPGRSLFANLSGGVGRAIWGGNDVAYALVGNQLYKVNPNASSSLVGTLGAQTTGPAQIVAGPSGVSAALLVWDGSNGQTAANTWWCDGVVAPFAVISSVGVTYCNGYFIALRPGGNDYGGDPIPINTQDQTQFNVSAIQDGSTWNPLYYAIREGAPDAIQMVFGPGTPGGGPEELWLLGKKTIEVWYAVPGTQLNPFPFQQVEGAFINQGLWAAQSVAGLADGIYYLAGDDRGFGVVMRMNGYIPQRVSTHAIEYQIQQAIISGSDVSDAIGYGAQYQGHNFYVLNFPTAGLCFAYDATENLWHQRTIGGSAGSPSITADRGFYHCTAFGKHLLLDATNGNIYESSLGIYDDVGDPLWRWRTAPHLDNQRLRTFFDRLQLDVGGYPGMATRTFYLEVSNDGGQTFGSPLPVTIGPSGDNSTVRVIWRMLGSSTNRVFRVSTADAVLQAWVDAYLSITPGSGM